MKVRIFKEKSIESLFENARNKAVKEIEKFNKDRLLNINANEIAAEISKTCKVVNIEIDFSKRTATPIIPSNNHESYKVRYKFIAPAIVDYISYSPVSNQTKTDETVTVEGPTFVYEYDTKHFNETLTEAKKIELKTYMHQLIEDWTLTISAYNSDVNQFNQSIASELIPLIGEAKQIEIAKRKNVHDLNDF